MRLKIVLAYVGTAYSGWQIQERESPPPTVQAALEQALATLAGGFVRIFGAGRTDSGVHAHGQVAHCDVPDDSAVTNWQHSLNALLPKDIRILSAVRCATAFHARRDAIRKTYIYRFWPETAFVPPPLAPFVWPCGPLDLSAMKACLPHLAGQQDYRSLQNAGTDLESTVRTIFAAAIEPMPHQEFYPPHAPELRLTITADGFLKQMVRNIAGLLASAGRGRIAPDEVPAILAARSRRGNPAMTAPAPGLALAHVDYGAPTA